MKNTSDAIIQQEQAAYLEALEPARQGVLAEMEALAKANGHPISDPEVASFLAITVALARPRRIVELGTNIGYGAIVMAQAAPEARVITIEKSPELARTARSFIAKAALSGRIEVREASALDALQAIEEPIDVLYIDCVKEEYSAYLEAAVPRLSASGVVVADNVLWKGHVARSSVPENERVRTEALRAFNRALVNHPQLRGLVLPLGDGVGYAVKR